MKKDISPKSIEGSGSEKNKRIEEIKGDLEKSKESREQDTKKMKALIDTLVSLGAPKEQIDALNKAMAEKIDEIKENAVKKEPKSKEQIEAEIAGVLTAMNQNEDMMKLEREKLIQQGEKLGYSEEEMAKILRGENMTDKIKNAETEEEPAPIITTEDVVVENNPKTLKISKQEKTKAKDVAIVKSAGTTKKKVVNKKTQTGTKMGDTVALNEENFDKTTTAEEGGDKKTPGTPEPIVKTAPEQISPEEKELDKKIEDAREKYVKEYKKCKKEVDKEVLIDKTRNSVFNILAGVKNIFSKKKIEYKKSIKVEDYFTKETTDAKKEYNQARIEMGEAMYNQKKSELEKAGLTGVDLETALTQYKATEILAKTIIDERQKIIDAKIEGLPIKPALWKRAIDAYMKIKPRWKRVALSTLLFLPVSATGAIGAGAIASYGIYGLAGLAGVKFGASMAIGAGVGHLAKGIDWVKKDADLKFNEKQNQERLRLENEFSTGKIGLEEYEKRIEPLENEDRQRNRNRVITKCVVGAALALAAGYGSYTAMGLGVEHMSHSVHSSVDAITGPDMSHTATGTTIEHTQPGTPSIVPDNSRPPLASAGTNPETGFNIKYPFPIKTPEAEHFAPGAHGVLKLHENIVHHANIEATALHGKGAIATLRELQHNLKVEYGNDLNNAPASVKHILNTDAHKLAQEYGMYKPGQDAESAFMKSGSSFKVDGNGNVTYHEIGVKTDISLEKGAEVKVNTQYTGKMFDSDHSGAKESFKAPVQVDMETGKPIITHPDNVKVGSDQFKAPAQVDMETGKPIATNNTDLNNPKLDLTPKVNSVKVENFNFGNKDHILSLNGKEGSIRMQFIYDNNGKIIDVYAVGHTYTTGPDPYTLEGELEKLGKYRRLDADVDIMKMTSNARFLDKLPHNTHEYEFLSEKVAVMQKEIINNYGNVLNPDKLVNNHSINIPTENLNINNNLNPELLEKVNQTYIKNIKHLFPDKKIEFWREIKDSYSVEKLMRINKEEGLADVYKPLASHIMKLEEISGLKPVLETAITKAESIPNFIRRAEEAIAKMGKLDEIKL